MDVHVGDVVSTQTTDRMSCREPLRELVRAQMNAKGTKDDHEIKRIERKATQEDIDVAKGEHAGGGYHP